MRDYYLEVLEQTLTAYNELNSKLEVKIDLITKLDLLTDLCANKYYREIAEIVQKAENVIEEDSEHKILYYHDK